MPHERVVAPGHDRSRGLGLLAVAWMEHFLIHGKGDIQGVPLNPAKGGTGLSNELARFTMDCYALNERGRRLYDSTFYSRPKGADKSGHQARLSIFEGLGPCRFGGWAKGGEIFEQGDFRYVYAPYEAMGQPIVAPYIRLLATEEGQTGNIYDAVLFNFQEGPVAQFLRWADDAGLGRINLPNGGVIQPSTASSSAKDGGLESFISFDETHLYIPAELHRMYETVRRNLAKRRAAEGWSNESSTTFEPGRGSVAEKTHELARSIREGKIANPRLLFDHREAPKHADFAHEDDLVHGYLREAYGDAASYMDLDRIISEARDPRNAPEDSRRYFFNQAVAGSSLAFDAEAWKKYTDADYVPKKGAFITLGFDGARTQDATALIATEIETGYQWPIEIWEKPDNAKDWYLDDASVNAAVVDAFEHFEVWRMYGDPSKWETEMARWRGRFGQERVIELPPAMSRRTALMFAAYAAAIRAGDTTHSNGPRFAAHIANAHKFTIAAKDDDGNNLWIIQKDRMMSPRKIDAAWAGAASWQARLDAVAAGVRPRSTWVVV